MDSNVPASSHASEKQGKQDDTETRFWEIVAEQLRQRNEHLRRRDIMSPDRSIDDMIPGFIRKECSC